MHAADAAQITDVDVNHNQPAFSPDGSQIYFLSWRSQFTDPETGKLRRANEVFRAELDGKNPVRLTERNAIAWHPEAFSTPE